MRSIIYARMSVLDDAALQRQIAAGRQHAAMRGYSVRREIRDIASGVSLERPGLDELFHLIKRAMIPVVIVSSPDRLARNTAQRQALQARIAEAGAVIEYVMGTETGLALPGSDALDPL